MANEESTTKFKLDLDSESFITNANKAVGAIKNLGNLESLGALVEGLEKVSGVVGVIGAAFFAIKGTIEAVFDAEKIKAVNNQFNTLATSAGVYSGTLKKGLVDAARGWTDETSLMQAANKAMVELEVGVDKLPELMDAARKATSVMGGDLITNFETMSQAVASGNTRLLRHLGIIVDQEKAYRMYAASIGVTVDVLSQAGKQQAIMDAVLAQTKTKFAGLETDIRQTTTAWNQFKTAMKEVGEVISLLIEKVAGGPLKSAFTSLKNVAEGMKTSLQAAFGVGTEKAEALEKGISKLKTQLEAAEKAKKSALSFDEANIAEMRVKSLTDQIKKYEDELNKTKTSDKQYLEEQKQHAAQEQVISANTTKAKTVDLDKQAAKRAEYQQKILALDKQELQEEMKSMKSIDEANALYHRKQQLEAREIEAQKAKIRAEERKGLIDHKSANDQIVRLNKIKDQRIAQDDAELAQMQKQALDNQVAQSENAFDGIGNAVSANAQRNKMAMLDAGQFGENVFSAFSTNAVSSLQAWGSGSQSATQAVQSMFAHMAGQMATQYGTMMMLSGLWPPNPPVIAAGAALVALGGYLNSVGGPSLKAPSMSSSGMGGASMGGGSDFSSQGVGAPLPSSAASQTSQGVGAVHIVVNGSVFDTDATRVRIADLVRQSSDSNDFSIERVGGGV